MKHQEYIANSKLRCAYCHCEMDGVLYSCSSCNAICHHDCWQELSACPTIGCANGLSEPTVSLKEGVDRLSTMTQEAYQSSNWRSNVIIVMVTCFAAIVFDIALFCFLLGMHFATVSNKVPFSISASLIFGGIAVMAGFICFGLAAPTWAVRIVH